MAAKNRRIGRELEMIKQFAFYFDGSACVGCKACQIACKDKYDLPVGVLWRRVIEYGGGNWVSNGDSYQPKNIFAYFLSISCMHCENPACVSVCPTKAMTKREDGAVIIDQSKCIGCRYCEWACPYGAPQFNDEKGVMTKCTSCADLRDAGEQPVCVSACTMRCLDFGELSELQAKYGNVNNIAPLPTNEITHPSLVITPHKDSQPNGSTNGSILNLEGEI